MPLLIYGAELDNEDEEITIDNFAEKIDPRSWEEFMPKGVSKQKFNAFKKYYDPDIFRAAGKRIRAMAKAADRLSVEERIGRITDIFSTFRNPDKETVLTPWRVVNMHLGDCLGGYNFFDKEYEHTLDEPRFIDHGKVTAEVFTSNARILEINSKSGLYPLYMAYSIYRARLKDCTISANTLEEQLAVWDKTVAENIFVVCKTPMAKSITKRTLVGFRETKTNMYAPDDLINKIKNQPELFIKKVHDLVDKDMKINAVVGNPPYQEEGISTRKTPIYHLFYDISFKLSDIVTLITPGRFLFRAGQAPSEWMNRILSDRHFKVIDYFQKSTDVFPSVEIKGGVAITLRDINQDFGAIGFFSQYAELRTILQKISYYELNTKERLSEIISSQGIYKFTDDALIRYPNIAYVQGKGTATKITSNSLENLPNIFLEQQPTNVSDYIRIIGRSKGQRVIRWIKKGLLQLVDSLYFYKVLIPEANGTGTIGEILSTPIIGTPMLAHTDTFLSIGKFDNVQEAKNCLKYIRTKFARTMLGTLKATQHNPRDTWNNVPLQDFTEHSDINWNCTISEIDHQLYAKYGLSEKEISFIEKMIKPM